MGKTYESLMDQLFHMNKGFGMGLGLERMQSIHKALHEPSKHYQSIHVAGTNGKGSVSLKVASALESKGYRCGLFISPHVHSFRERISINGRLITQDEVVHLLPKILKVPEAKHFFEITTALAMQYFYDKKVDYAVFEAGLGGRLDATNILTPKCSAITSIGFDHQDILGETLEEITFDKASIIKPNTPIIIGPTVLEDVVKKVAGPLCAPVIKVSGPFNDYMDENDGVALNILKKLDIYPEQISNDQKGVNLPCRLECLNYNGAKVVIDAAHNLDGINALFQILRKRYPKKSFRGVVGFSKDKPIQKRLNIALENTSCLHIVSSKHHRLMEEKEIYKIAHQKNRLTVHNSVQEGIQNACIHAKEKDEILVIFGTFFIMDKVRRYFGLYQGADESELNEMRD